MIYTFVYFTTLGCLPFEWKISTPVFKINILLSWSLLLSCKTKLMCEKMFDYYNQHHWRRRQRQSLVHHQMCHHQMCHHRHCYLDHQQGCQLVCWGELDPQTILALCVCLLPPSWIWLGISTKPSLALFHWVVQCFAVWMCGRIDLQQ